MCGCANRRLQLSYSVRASGPSPNVLGDGAPDLKTSHRRSHVAHTEVDGGGITNGGGSNIRSGGGGVRISGSGGSGIRSGGGGGRIGSGTGGGTTVLASNSISGDGGGISGGGSSGNNPHYLLHHHPQMVQQNAPMSSVSSPLDWHTMQQSHLPIFLSASSESSRSRLPPYKSYTHTQLPPPTAPQTLALLLSPTHFKGSSDSVQRCSGSFESKEALQEDNPSYSFAAISPQLGNISSSTAGPTTPPHSPHAHGRTTGAFSPTPPVSASPSPSPRSRSGSRTSTRINPLFSSSSMLAAAQAPSVFPTADADIDTVAAATTELPAAPGPAAMLRSNSGPSWCHGH